MKPFLLDVHVLIALLDPAHTHHDRAHVSLGAALATFDERIVTTAVPHAERAVFHIP